MINKVIPALMLAIGDIGKEKTAGNGNFAFKFRGIDDVLNHVGPACAKLGVRVEVDVIDHSEDRQDFVEKTERSGTKFEKQKFRIFARLKMIVRFIAEDDSVHTCSAIGSSMDTSGDKATNKAMSAAFKYICFLGLVIPVEGALDESDDTAPADDIVSESYEETEEDWHSWEIPFKASRRFGETLGGMVIEEAKEDIFMLDEWIGKQMTKAEQADETEKFKYYQKAKALTAKALIEVDNLPVSPTEGAAEVKESKSEDRADLFAETK
jgi:hypothetical protein